MNYDPNVYTEIMMKLLEPDLRFIASRYYVPGQDREDLEQELRITLWLKLPTFDPNRGVSLRTYASQIMRNKLKNMLRDSMAKKRYGGECLPLIDDFSEFHGKDVESQELFFHILDVLNQYGLSVDDFF